MDKILTYLPNGWNDKGMICGENHTSFMVRINRKCYDDSITSFAICEECLQQIGKEALSHKPTKTLRTYS